MVKKSEDNFENTFEGAGSDDSLLVDLSNVEAMSFEALPKGLYQATVDECEFQISKSSGQPMWSVRFVITEGEFTNRKIFTYMSFSEKALPMTKTNIAALAPELLEGPFNPKKAADDAVIVGRACTLKLGIEDGQDGEPRNKVSSIKPSQTAGSAASDF